MSPRRKADGSVPDMSKSIYRSSRTVSLLGYLHRNGPTRKFHPNYELLPSPNAMRKMCAAGLITCEQAYRIADGRRDILTLEITITEVGRETLMQWTGDDPHPTTPTRTGEGESV